MEVTAGSSESSTVEQLTHEQHDHVRSEELQLGLGLSLGGLMGTSTKNHHNDNNNNKSISMQIPRFLTAKDLPCSSTSSCSSCLSLGLRAPTAKTNTKICVGTKRAVSPTALSQVVGWPPIRQYRMSSMANQANSIANGERNSQFDESQGKDKGYANSKDKVPCKSPLFVKVNMDGVAIGRKVDLTAHSDYESLARALGEMFTNKAEKSNAEELTLMRKVTRPSKLLDGTSDFVLTYEDKDGDWMLVGDVPWGMFVTSVKRLKIMRTSEANGLAPRSEVRSSKQKSRPI